MVRIVLSGLITLITDYHNILNSPLISTAISKVIIKKMVINHMKIRALKVISYNFGFKFRFFIYFLEIRKIFYRFN